MISTRYSKSLPQMWCVGVHEVFPMLFCHLGYKYILMELYGEHASDLSFLQYFKKGRLEF